MVSEDNSGAALGLGAFASRQMVTAGNSVLLASRAVAEKAKKLASHLLEAAEHDLELKDGEVCVAGSDRAVKSPSCRASSRGRLVTASRPASSPASMHL